MTLEEFERQLSDLGQRIEDSPSALVQLGEEIVAQMRLRVPVDTGALRNSIRYAVEGNTLTFLMLPYGAFQNYGVKGAGGPNVNPVPFGVNPQPSMPPFFEYRNRSFGINPQPFYDFEQISAQIVEALQNNVNP